MEQFFTHYTNWEDWKHGMWNKSESPESDLIKAIDTLVNPNESMNRVVSEWPVSTKQALTDVKSNRRSWLGQAACCISNNVPESITRLAWGKLTDEQRLNANNIATKIILEWEKNYLG